MWKILSILMMAGFLLSCSTGRYKPGDCFQWNYNKYDNNQILGVEAFRYRYKQLGYGGIIGFAKIEYLDKNTTKSSCALVLKDW